MTKHSGVDKEMKKEIMKILDDIFYQGVDAGGYEYGGENWSSEEYADMIIQLAEEIL